MYAPEAPPAPADSPLALSYYAPPTPPAPPPTANCMCKALAFVGTVTVPVVVEKAVVLNKVNISLQTPPSFT